jgi:hypothetical protein
MSVVDSPFTAISRRTSIMPRFKHGQYLRRGIEIIACTSLFEDRNHGVIQTAAMDRFEECKSDIGYWRRTEVGGHVRAKAEGSHGFSRDTGA